MTVVDELPPIEAFLEHYGVKGMKWGKRNVRPDEAERKARFSPKAKKIAKGTAAVAGAVAVAYLATQHGGVKVSSLGGLSDPKSPLYQATVAGKRAANATLTTATRATKMADIPNAQRALAKPQFRQIRSQLAIEAAKQKKASSAASSSTKYPDYNDIQRKLEDPNYVWEL